MRQENGLRDTVIILVALFFALMWAHRAWSAEIIDTEQLATAIRRAEGNSNYGILKSIKGKNYRLACIQTIRHAQKDYLKGAVKGQDFISFLANRYAPLNVKNDPKHLNENWKRNVLTFYKKSS